MKLEKKQKQWLVDLGAKEAIQAKLQAREDLKVAVLKNAFRDREKQAKELFEGTNQTVIKEGTGKTQATHNFVTRDQKKLFDMDEQRKGYVLAEIVTNEMGEEETRPEEWNGKTGEQKNFQKLQKAGRIVTSLALQMQQEVEELDENGDPVMIDVKTPTGTVKQKKMVSLFSTAELKEELYTPLVRRGLIPETNVPDDYSATKEMVDSSLKAYGNRLSREKKKGLFAENLSLGIAVFRGCLSFAGQVQGLDAASKLPASQLQWSPDQNPLDSIEQGFGLKANDTGAVDQFTDTAGQVAQAFIYAQNVSDMAFDLGMEGVEEIGTQYGDVKANKEKAAQTKAAGKVGGAAVGEMATALGAALNDYGLGIAASSAFGALVPGPKIARKIAENDIAGCKALLWTAFSTTLTRLDPKQGTSTADIQKALGKAKTAFDGAFKPEEVLKSLEKKAFEKAASSLAAAAVAAAKEIQQDVGLSIVFTNKANADAAQANAGQVVSEEFERDDRPKPKPEQIQKHPKDHEAQWVETKEGFLCLKCAKGNEDPELFAGILERKIKQLEMDQAIWKWITAVGGMGFDVASDFVAPLAICGALLRLAKNANEAMKRFSDVKAFLTDQSNMLRAASEFSAPLSQFVANAEKQLSHYSFNAAMEGLKVVAAALQMGYVTAPVGVGLSGGANIAQAVESVLYEAKKRWDLETGWRSYKDALENPDNRKIGLNSLAENPTLAKYSVAWGALIKKDPLVGNFMHHCQLNHDTLKDPEANLDLVVKYLETRMPDDNVVVGRDYSAPNKVLLTAEVWIKEKTRAEKKLKVKEQKTQRLEYLLTQWSTEYPLQKSAKPKNAEAVEKCRAILDDIDLELLKYQAVDSADKRVIDALNMKQKFTRQVNVFRQEMKDW